jgi:hypothetical protein
VPFMVMHSVDKKMTEVQIFEKQCEQMISTVKTVHLHYVFLPIIFHILFQVAL